MSDMKLYRGHYSYDGTFKQQKDGSSLLEVRWFVYGGKHYQPSETINFVIREEPENWISVTDDSVGAREGGKTIEEAIGNAFMMIVDQYDDFAFYTGSLSKRAQVLKEKFRSWEVHAVDQQAQ